MKHGPEFATCVDEDEYEKRAIQFASGPKPASAEWHECQRRDGGLVRYNASTGEFLATDGNGRVRTYFRRLVTDPATRAAGIAYFKRQC